MGLYTHASSTLQQFVWTGGEKGVSFMDHVALLFCCFGFSCPLPTALCTCIMYYPMLH